MKSEKKHKLIEALSEAQKIAFSPLMFQAVNCLIELNILNEIDCRPQTKKELQDKLNLSDYILTTLLEVALINKIAEKKEDKFYITLIGEALLYDEMTRVNFNFTKDVCYIGANKLKESFLSETPFGIKEIFKEAKTIYPYISKLPDKMKKSWYEFDHYYSDNCFDIIYKMITPISKITDIGGNTGKFEKVVLKNNPNQDILMVDLPENIEIIKNDPELSNCSFFATDILDEKQELPKLSGAVFMSQFLDCFSKEQIKLILNKIYKASSSDIKVYILEPLIDRQKFEGAKYSIIHTSLYFTCMANGKSKMYNYSDFEELINETGFEIKNSYDGLGAHDYTLIECVIKK